VRLGFINPERFAVVTRPPSPSTRERVREFIENPGNRVLTFYGDNITAVNGLPKKVPRGITKMIYFLKIHAAAVSSDPSKDILVNEMGPEPLEHLEKILSEVFLPLLSNPANQDGWGEVASKEIVFDRMHGFLAKRFNHGRTDAWRDLPPAAPAHAATAAAVSNKDRVHLPQGRRHHCGSKQIKNVLEQDPESLLKAGLHPTPDAEVEFRRSESGQS